MRCFFSFLVFVIFPKELLTLVVFVVFFKAMREGIIKAEKQSRQPDLITIFSFSLRLRQIQK